MVTPGNPLKSRNHLAPLAERIALSEAIAADPRIKVTAFEQSLGVSYTANTLARVKARNPHVHFVWIMGADSLKTFHHWQNWQEIARTFPIAVIDRPGATLSYLSSKMAKNLRFRAYRRGRCPCTLEEAGTRLDLHSRAALGLSSTAIRNGSSHSDANSLIFWEILENEKPDGGGDPSGFLNLIDNWEEECCRSISNGFGRRRSPFRCVCFTMICE